MRKTALVSPVVNDHAATVTRCARAEPQLPILQSDPLGAFLFWTGDWGPWGPEFFLVVFFVNVASELKIENLEQ